MDFQPSRDHNTSIPPIILSNKGIFHRIKIKINKLYLKNTTNYPFISGDSIANCTDYYVFGPNNDQKVDVDKLKSSKSIFVSSHMLEKLLGSHFDSIGAKVLVTGNSDKNFDNLTALPQSILLWVSQNNSIESDPRIFPLPIGIENKRLGRTGFESYHGPINNFSILDKILIPPMSPTNSVRHYVTNRALNAPYIFDVSTKYLSERKYFNLVRNYKFIFCCEGNGFENHRIWEALYQNSFPVMLETKWSKTLKRLKLPILFVASIDELNKKMLMDFRLEHADFQSRQTPQLWVEFWKNLIASGDINYAIQSLET